MRLEINKAFKASLYVTFELISVYKYWTLLLHTFNSTGRLVCFIQRRKLRKIRRRRYDVTYCVLKDLMLKSSANAKMHPVPNLLFHFSSSFFVYVFAQLPKSTLTNTPELNRTVWVIQLQCMHQGGGASQCILSILKLPPPPPPPPFPYTKWEGGGVIMFRTTYHGPLILHGLGTVFYGVPVKAYLINSDQVRKF